MQSSEARSVPELVAAIDAGARPAYLLFWSHREVVEGRVTKACLSQWYPSPFSVDGVIYRTAEHYMMAAKARLFGDHDMLEQILAAASPGAAKAFGRAVHGYEQSVWDENRYEIVVSGNHEKFARNPKLLAFLLGTEQRVLVEASPSDKIWGIGLSADDGDAEKPRKWRGLNLLGFALMEARDRLHALDGDAVPTRVGRRG